MTADSTPATGTWFGHPRGLATLFFTELWERFSYYGMRGLLVLFMTAEAARGGFGFDAATAGAIYGLYTAGVYLLALPGGWIADKLIGQRRAVFIGGCIIALGHFSMAVPSMPFFFAGLVLIVIGTGLLKPNVSTIVGELYPEGGARRDAGFSIFYMGINIGAFLGPLVCGLLGEKVNWHYGFAAAGVGMVLGLIQYSLGTRHLAGAGELKLSGNAAADTSSKRSASRVLLVSVILGIALIALLVSGMIDITLEQAANATGVIILSVTILYFIWVMVAGKLDGAEKKRVLVVAALFLFSALFWSGFEQAGSSMNLFAERLTDREFFDWLMPASWLQSVNALFIIIFAPVFASLWIGLARRKKEPSSPAKFTLGLLLLGLGFVVLAFGSMAAASGELVSVNWLVITYLLHTWGELCLSPVGLSMVTKLAPARMVGQMMGIWFMSISFGNLVAGQVGGLFETLPLPQLFGAVAATTIGAGVILALLIIPIKKMMGGVN